MLWKKLSWFGRRDIPAKNYRTVIYSGHLKPDAVCSELSQLIDEMPRLEAPLSPEAKHWLRSVYSLVLAGGHTMEAAALSSRIEKLNSRVPDIEKKAGQKIVPILDAVLAMARVRAAAVHGSGIPISRPAGVLAAFSNILPTATRDVLIIAPYLEEKMLDDFAALVLDNVRVRLLASEKQWAPSLKSAPPRMIGRRYAGREPEVRLAPLARSMIA